jgi:hypothetical protein
LPVPGYELVACARFTSVDVASLIDFDTRVRVLQGFTSDQAALEAAIRKTAAGGATALYNAVYIALKELNKTVLDETLSQSRRRAIVPGYYAPTR